MISYDLVTVACVVFVARHQQGVARHRPARSGGPEEGEEQECVVLFAQPQPK